ARHVRYRNAFGDADDQRYPGVCSFHDGVRGEWRRYKNDGRVGSGFANALLDGIEDRAIEMRLAAFARRLTAHHMRSVRDRLLSVKSAFLAGKALHHEARRLIDQNAHRLRPPRAAPS